MILTLKIAWRSVWRNKRRTLITLSSIAFGLGLTIFFISLSNGAYNQIIEDAARMQAGHITIENKDYRDAPSVDLYIADPDRFKAEIEALPDVGRTKVIITGQGVAKSGNGAIGIAFLGIQPSLEKDMSPVADKITEGEFLEDDDVRQVVIGSVLAKRLNLAIGKKLVISSNDIEGNLVEELCRVKGIFTTGVVETDTYFVLMPVNFARQLVQLPPNAINQFGIILKDPGKLITTRNEIRKIVKDDSLSVLTWKEVMPEIAAFIELDFKSGIIFYMIIICLALFTIYNTIFMSVLERKHEFAIMLAIGTSPRILESQIVAESVFLGFTGSVMGAILGGLTAYYYQVNGLDFSAWLHDQSAFSVGGAVMESVIYNKITPVILFGCSGLVFLSTILLSFIPMKRASKISFSDILR
jgi:ABC-type lipoprotein release transport system permease subunit